MQAALSVSSAYRGPADRNSEGEQLSVRARAAARGQGFADSHQVACRLKGTRAPFGMCLKRQRGALSGNRAAGASREAHDVDVHGGRVEHVDECLERRGVDVDSEDGGVPSAAAARRAAVVAPA